MKKRNYRKAIVMGFLTVYVMSMFYSTSMAEENYADRHKSEAERIVSDMKTMVNNVDKENRDHRLFAYLLTYALSANPELKYNQVSAALYDQTTGDKITQTSILMTDGMDHHLLMGKKEPHAYAVGQYMNEEVQELLLQMEMETREAKANGNYPKYSYSFWSDGSPYNMGFSSSRIIWDKSADGGIYNSLTSKVKDFEQGWGWDYTDFSKGEIKEKEYEYMSTDFMYYDLGLIFPYLENGYNSWKKWQSDEHLQNYPETLEEERGITTGYYAFATIKTENEYKLDDYILIVRQSSNSWLAAADYMKYVYLAGFIIMLACMLKVLYTTEKTYKEQAKLEETRRDFTNAIAHELKTPLGVIRGFAENLKENTYEEKRDYYLEQIVGQTERMDEMVKEMIYISKLDSDKFVLDKKEVSFKKLIDEALESLSIYIEEKHLQVSYKGLSDRVIEGDPQYLKKAIWNLVSNAVEYNRQNGQVEIIFEESALKIRNTGNQIPEEDLSHVFDMFYTGNKSRTSGESHLGLGLYLSKKILNMHGLQVIIGNIQDGVEVVIKK